jgi:transposase-like protein
MPAKNPPTGTDQDLNLATMASLFNDENEAREFFESKRWPNGAICPHCKSHEVKKLVPKETSKSPGRPGLYQCNDCREQFSAKTGSIMEDSKGVSSHQIARECGITQKSAWFMNHRIREAMKREPMASILANIVEVDEAYIGGKPRKKTGKHKRGAGTPKAPIMVLVERDGNARCFPLPEVTSTKRSRTRLRSTSPRKPLL